MKTSLLQLLNYRPRDAFNSSSNTKYSLHSVDTQTQMFRYLENRYLSCGYMNA